MKDLKYNLWNRLQEMRANGDIDAKDRLIKHMKVSNGRFKQIYYAKKTSPYQMTFEQGLLAAGFFGVKPSELMNDEVAEVA